MGPESGLSTIHGNVLPAVQRAALAALGGCAGRAGFHLAGGTAVAIHLGQRQSIDLDWFTPSALDEPLALANRLRSETPDLETASVTPGTLHAHIRGVRCRFLSAGLSYTDDAEREPMPVMLVPVDWNEVKNALRSWVKEYAAQ